MIELEVNERKFLINPKNICFVSLGDGSLPYKRSLSVCIKFNNGCFDFTTCSSNEANKLYKRIKELIEQTEIK